MKNLKISLLSILLFLIGSTMYAEEPINVVRGEQDTVYTKKHNIICITNPGNIAAINNQQVRVYKTGAFGMEVTLSEGDNVVEITVFKNNNRTIKKLNIYYSNTPKPQKTYTLSEAEKKLNKNLFHEMLCYVTSKDGAYLQYGDGEDRLGGSKLGFIQEGIVLKVVGEIRDLYKIQLSNNRYAYMEKDYTQITDKCTKQVNTGSWSVFNNGKCDRIVIPLPERIPYSSWTELDPTTICVDLYGATNNSNWIVQKQNLAMIDYVDYRQPESDVFRVIIKLKEKYSWGHSIKYEGNNLIIDVKHTPNLTLKGMTIGLDAGHGGSASGAVSATGIKEKDLTLKMVNILKGMLEKKGVNVVLSRDGDQDMTMKERKKKFLENDIDLLISIHCNAGGSPFVSMGTSAYYKHICNRDFASCLLNRMLELGLPNYGLIGNFNFSLNGPIEYPNALMEVLFMSSLPDEEKLADTAYLHTLMQNTVLGLEDYMYKVQSSQEQQTKVKNKKRK